MEGSGKGNSGPQQPSQDGCHLVEESGDTPLKSLPEVDPAGFSTKTTKKSKAAKAKARKALRDGHGDRGGGNASDNDRKPFFTTSAAGAASRGHMAQRVQDALNPQEQSAGKRAITKKGKVGATKARAGTRFDRFQRHEALGQYGARAESDSDEEDAGSMEVDDDKTGPQASMQDLPINEDQDDAPYAFPDSEDLDVVTGLGDARDIVVDTTVITQSEHTAQEGPMPMDEDTIAAPTVPRIHKRSTRRSKHAATGVGLPEGAIKGMQTSMANYFQHAASKAATERPEAPAQNESHSVDAVAEFSKEEESKTEEDCPADGIVAATPDSQDDVVIGDTRMGSEPGDSDLPIQTGQWLQSFRGCEVKVEANGQCAFLAVLATKINHAGPEMTNTAEAVKDATDLKRGVYTLMMANLRRDVALNLVDPISECAKLYPDQDKYTTTYGAVAALYAHYDSARRRSAGRKVSASFWAGPHELRALAQYCREPIIVFDANEASDAHVQRYFYGKYRLPGTDHESGYVLRHHERHFYGVSHGELFLRWRAEGDLEFTGEIAADLDWKDEVNAMTDYEPPHGARVTWYEEFPFLRSLCHGVVDHSDWSSATLAPTGQAWGESQDDDISSPESPRRN
ncbi:hypothetical protein PR002_g17672 [Phytophthora rubi]|uniref:OTU domain-containing protein n=1 Tax=Phytophthora rubi TaxID=129364 RepID=A0A6A3K527_9STRA|nr:hypothetical protein PR002_g17672 [Phytophthora rubi]